MLGTTKSPVALVTAGAEVVPFDWLIEVMVAPGTTAPCVSLTVPLTVPVTPCAAAGAAMAIARQRLAAALVRRPRPSRRDIRCLPSKGCRRECDYRYRHVMLSIQVSVVLSCITCRLLIYSRP